MVTRLRDVLDFVERKWPSSGAESWDSVGLVSGALDAEIRRILLAVDAAQLTVQEAVDTSADLLLIHHPLLLRGVTTVAETTAKGSLLAQLIRADVALIAAHTNADVVQTGTSAALAAALDLEGSKPIVPAASDPERGLGRIGVLREPTTLGALARKLAGILPSTATGIRAAGSFERVVETIALCGGAGDSLLNDPAVLGADVYITSDLRHHPASESLEQSIARGTGPALIDTSHWASEWLWLDYAARELQEEFPQLQVEVSELRTDPWDFAIPQ
ncbi:Nif3-like dinuclear metal center hexameric protein [Pseudoclavibacter sp. AY1F1]|uniref:Nif3-like dinuclear metal center hexameric protein n=1 Tax=Pseudoclavibacter sp. AY1F1 TaxID=2080583 RepID=UPI000CE849AA|nr:Nif3-like dinuclear metal center hexameric protein [Pseudoclavibacter sp. AY1F1]PPF47253.1 Nif3-like dinuclear metal center hexameric protein [Pseudoclavibacter sp. AY1F1]